MLSFRSLEQNAIIYKGVRALPDMIQTKTVKPILDLANNSSVQVLAKDTATFTMEGIAYSSACEALLHLSPRPSLVFQAKVPDGKVSIPQMLGMIEPPKDFCFRGKEIAGFHGGYVGDCFVWIPESEPVISLGDDKTMMSRIVFHLFNHHEFMSLTEGLSETRGRSSVAIHQTSLKSEIFRIVINSLFETSDNARGIRSEGGCKCTHAAEICKQDGSLISGAEASNLLATLKDFFSFANGIRLAPVCATGFDAAQNEVWSCWNSPISCDPPLETWFDRNHPVQLQSLFPDFVKTLSSEVWGRPLHEAIYWYVRSCNSHSGIDANIILIQAALELLAYTHIVNDKQLLTAKGFKDLWASDKIRLLLGSLGIPCSIPANCKSIYGLIQSNSSVKWTDLPHAFSDIRNSLVHPDVKNRDVYSQAYLDAWKAGLWMVEMVILRVCGYRDTYSNRLTTRYVGTVESVPWMQMTP